MVPVEDRVPPVPLTRLVLAPATCRSPHSPLSCRGGLQQEEHAVHAGVAVGKSAAVGVHWEVAAGSSALVGDEVGALAPSAEAEGLRG